MSVEDQVHNYGEIDCTYFKQITINGISIQVAIIARTILLDCNFIVLNGLLKPAPIDEYM